MLCPHTVYIMNKRIALILMSPLVVIATVSALPATAASTKTAKVGATCTKSGTKAKTAKGSALVCKKSGAKLKWALAPKAAADTTVAKGSDTTIKKATDTTIKKATDTTIKK